VSAATDRICTLEAEVQRLKSHKVEANNTICLLKETITVLEAEAHKLRIEVVAARSSADANIAADNTHLSHPTRGLNDVSGGVYADDVVPFSKEDDVLNREVRYGELSTKVVGIQYYAGKVKRNEPVRLVREPNNPEDYNAIMVLNIRDEQVGYIPRDVAVHLSPMLGGRTLHHLEGKITSRTTNKFVLTLTVVLYGWDCCFWVWSFN
jgi:uncharacterized small protein (DUF1192 family)